ncbi:Uncharacterised protein [Mycobacteroides abscessus subsp. abscessus]|nr:Uncharacterised protein [Mycobacteroides abscessus subsp. abscessus]
MSPIEPVSPRPPVAVYRLTRHPGVRLPRGYVYTHAYTQGDR